ncbi:MAG TPA: hypothetical protein VKB43_12745 [Gaiellaceae bacterium]|nr:hypothetical protein [Gaiellaceae bacterium]
MIRRILQVVLVVAAVVLVLGFAVGPHLGWATPFSVPTQVSYRGTNFYLDDTRCLEPRELPRAYLPMRRTASMFGYFTGSRAVLLPHYEWKRRTIDEGLLLVDVHHGCLKYYVTADSG